MTDIMERLRMDYIDPSFHRLLREAAAEIERLRKDLDGEYAINSALNGVNRSVRAEIERLRAQIGAKDAALQRAREDLAQWYDADEVLRMIDVALAAPTYEWGNGGRVTMDISGFSDEEVEKLRGMAMANKAARETQEELQRLNELDEWSGAWEKRDD